MSADFARLLVWDDMILHLQDQFADEPTPIYLVGGVVRDAFLRRPLKDIDLVVPGSGITLARRIANAFKGDFYPLDKERDIGRAILQIETGKLIVDVSRFRGADLDADLRDRDFTINAMAVDVRGDLNAVIDPLDGERDLRTHVLRRCSQAALANDPIRALRAVRQSVALNLRIEPETLRDIRAAAGMDSVSPERIRDEFFNLLGMSKTAIALRIADTLGLLRTVLPEMVSGHAFTMTLQTVEQLTQIISIFAPTRTDETAAKFSLGMMVTGLDRYRHPVQTHLETVWANDRPHRALLILATLLQDTPNLDIETVAEQLRLSSAEKDRLNAIYRSRSHFDVLGDLTPLTIYRYWREPDAAGIDIILMSMATYLARHNVALDQDAWLKIVERTGVLFDAYFEQRDHLVDPPPLVDGRDLMNALNLKPGSLIGQLLEHIREGQVVGEVHTVEDALDYARRVIDNDSS